MWHASLQANLSLRFIGRACFLQALPYPGCVLRANALRHRRMKFFHTHQLAPAAMIGPDGLHITDASYGCLASQLAEALAWNWWSHGKIAKSLHQNPGAVSGLSYPATAPVSVALRPY